MPAETSQPDLYRDAEAAHVRLSQWFAEIIERYFDRGELPPDEFAAYQLEVQDHAREAAEVQRRYATVYPLRPGNIDTKDKFIAWLTERRDLANWARQALDDVGQVPGSRKNGKGLQELYDAFELGRPSRRPGPAADSRA